MPALQRYFAAERRRRGWSVREAAKYCKISPSKAYAIEAGDDNVEFETFENIADAFKMSPAELAVAIGKGRVDDDPGLVALQARIREVPKADRGMVDRLLDAFVPTRAKSPSTASAKSRQRARSTASTAAEESVNSLLEDRKHGVRFLAPVLSF